MKRFAVLAVALASLVSCDVPPSAPEALRTTTAKPQAERFHTNETFDIAGTIANPCPPGELVAYQGRIHLNAKGDYDPAIGQTFTVISNLQNFSGIGLTSGDRYRLQQNYKDEVTMTFSPDFTLDETFAVRFRINRQGSADNLWLRQTIRFTFPPDNIELIRNDMECRG
jgi:hypothetical protein